VINALLVLLTSAIVPASRCVVSGGRSFSAFSFPWSVSFFTALCRTEPHTSRTHLWPPDFHPDFSQLAAHFTTHLWFRLQFIYSPLQSISVPIRSISFYFGQFIDEKPPFCRITKRVGTRRYSRRQRVAPKGLPQCRARKNGHRTNGGNRCNEPWWALYYQYLQWCVPALPLIGGCPRKRNHFTQLIRFGTLPVLQALPLFVAADKGYFKERGSMWRSLPSIQRWKRMWP